MSDWTYVRGCLELDSSPFELSKDFTMSQPKRENYKTDKEYENAVDEYRTAYHNAIYLPYPEEQFKLGSPILGSKPDTTKKKKKNKWGGYSYPEKKCISFDDSVIYSLPRAKPIIEEAFKLFPQGELGFRYVLDQKAEDSTSSMSGFIHPCLYEYYKKAVDKMYAGFNQGWKAEWNYEYLEKYIGIDDDCFYDTVSEIICGINTSLRYATADEFYIRLLKVIDYLTQNDIRINHGYLEWRDSYTCYDGFIYAFRTGNWMGEWSIMKLDLETNKIIWKHSHIHPKKDDGKIDFDTFIDVEEDVK